MGIGTGLVTSDLQRLHHMAFIHITHPPLIWSDSLNSMYFSCKSSCSCVIIPESNVFLGIYFLFHCHNFLNLWQCAACSSPVQKISWPIENTYFRFLILFEISIFSGFINQTLQLLLISGQNQNRFFSQINWLWRRLSTITANIILGLFIKGDLLKDKLLDA